MSRPLPTVLAALLAVACLDEGTIAEGVDSGAPADSDTGDGGADTDPDASPGAGFGEPCEVDADCADGVCHEFGQLGRVCTIPCETDEDCPEGSQGRKCNSSGVCRP